jgi:hypothetical protein
MRLLTIVPAGLTEPAAVERRADEIGAMWRATGDDAVSHRLSGSVEYAEFLDTVLDAQPDVVLIVGAGGDDSVVTPIADVVWKFDNSCRVAVDSGPSAVDRVIVAAGDAPDVVGALRVTRQPTHQPAKADGAAPPRGGTVVIASVGWAVVDLDLISPDTAAQLRAAVDAGERAGLAFTDGAGYRHWPAVAADAPGLLAALEHERLATLVAEAMGSPEVWLGDLEVLGASDGWLRHDVGVLAATAGADFRPSVSVLSPINDELTVAVQNGSHRLRGAEFGGSGPVHAEEVSLRPGQALLVAGGSRHRLVSGRALHLRFIRGWMKPAVLLFQALGERAELLGPRGRQWCGADIGLPISVAEFLQVEEASVTGGLAQRKGSGI